MSIDKKEYDRFKGLLSGCQVNELSSEELMKSLFTKAELKVGKSSSVYLLHDPCDIRKPYSSDLDQLGEVVSLEGQVVKGYKSFNSVLVEPKQTKLTLLSHQLYSNADVDYVKVEKLRAIESGKLEDAALSSKIAEGTYYNSRTIYRTSLRKLSRDLKTSNPCLEITHISDREFDDASLYDLIANDLADFFITRAKISRASNAQKTLLTPKGKISKKVAYTKLIKKSFATKRVEILDKVRIKNKVYQSVKRIMEWEEVELDGQIYNVLRITLLDRKGNSIFKNPMLLITNHPIKDLRKAKVIYRAYLMRSKIEMVFKFCKNNLGWESFQIRDFTTIKNLLALVFFIAGYFYEIQKEIVKDDNCIRLAEIGGGKGKTTLHFILKGLEKVASYKLVQHYMQQHKMSKNDLEKLRQFGKTKPS